MSSLQLRVIWATRNLGGRLAIQIGGLKNPESKFLISRGWLKPSHCPTPSFSARAKFTHCSSWSVLFLLECSHRPDALLNVWLFRDQAGDEATTSFLIELQIPENPPDSFITVLKGRHNLSVSTQEEEEEIPREASSPSCWPFDESSTTC